MACNICPNCMGSGLGTGFGMSTEGSAPPRSRRLSLRCRRVPGVLSLRICGCIHLWCERVNFLRLCGPAVALAAAPLCRSVALAAAPLCRSPLAALRPSRPAVATTAALRAGSCCCGSYRLLTTHSAATAISSRAAGLCMLDGYTVEAGKQGATRRPFTFFAVLLFTPAGC